MLKAQFKTTLKVAVDLIVFRDAGRVSNRWSPTLVLVPGTT